MLDFCDFIQVYVFTTNHHLKAPTKIATGDTLIFSVLSFQENNT